MRISAEAAREFYVSIPRSLRAPCFDPHYVIADSRREAAGEPVFFLHRSGSSFWLHSVLRTVLPGGLQGFDHQSPYGYGGPLSNSTDEAFLRDAWRAYSSWCLSEGVIAEFVRFHPLLANWRAYGGETFPNRTTVWVDLRAPDLTMTYDKRVRTAIRKAENEKLRVEWIPAERLSSVFAPFYREQMKALGAADFYAFPDAYFDEMARWPSVHVLECRRGDALVGASMFLHDGARAEYHLSASNSDGKKSGASNLMLHQGFLKMRELGAETIHLGGGTDPDPKNPLFFFKTGFSPERAEFRVGTHVHDLTTYENIREQWTRRHGEPPKRVLFYREKV